MRVALRARHMRTHLVAVACLFLMLSGTQTAAQTATAQPLTLGDVTVSGSARVRAYSWDWFDGSDSGDYSYPGTIVRAALSQSHKTHDWQVEFALPLVFDLPSSAVAPAPQGQLGLGASYFAANRNATNNASLFLKQGYFRWKDLGGRAGQTLKVGRLEFNDGAEVTPKDASLAALKRDRISQRLLGNFGFSDVGRSVDGAQYTLMLTKTTNLTALAARPTQGVFQVDGWRELDINVFYGAVTGQLGGGAHPGEWRAFALGYDDYRAGVVKTDNRPAAARAADTGSIVLGTYGGHYLQVVPTAAGPIDVLAWGAVQAGRWGSLTQRAGAFALEGGWQPAWFDRMKPWIRGGIDYGSGDGDAADTTHGTFFQVLPTPRIYARLPFYNMMNGRDAFAELVLHPAKKLSLRTDAHALRLAAPADLWYSGGGAFQPQTFGYTGRPSNGQTTLATLYDLSGDYALTPRLAAGGYYGEATRGAVASAIYPSGGNVHLGYLELLVRF
jgi:hypothetical protein